MLSNDFPFKKLIPFLTSCIPPMHLTLLIFSLSANLG